MSSTSRPPAGRGVTFAEACRTLARDHQAGVRPWVSWGDYDRNQFTRQCRHTNTEYPFSADHTNAKIRFTQAHNLRKRPGMAQALEIAGLKLDGRHHRGDDDSWNIAALVLHLRANNSW